MQNYQGPSTYNFGTGETDGGAMGHALLLAITGGLFAVTEIPLLRRAAWGAIKGGGRIAKGAGKFAIGRGRGAVMGIAAAAGIYAGGSVLNNINNEARSLEQYDGLVQNLSNIGGNIF